MLNVRNFFIILTLTFLITVYLKQIPTNINKSENYNNNLIKHIVAYSLKKKIEIESEPVACEENRERLRFAEANLFVNGKWNRLEDSQFYVYSVYEDARLAPYNYVRVLGMAKGNWNETLFCNVVLKNISVQVTRAVRTEIWSENWIDENVQKNFNPILFSCQIPNLNEETQLYLNRNPCETSSKTLIHSTVRKNYHKFTYKRRNNKVALCVKPLDFNKDISRRLMEWIEINKILGGSYFNIFVKNVHPNVMKVLRWYGSREKRFRVVKFANPGANRWDIWQKRKTEILTYNDCFYYNLDLVDYILPIDIDEIIVPKVHYRWQEIFTKFPENYASFSVRNAYFLSGPNRTGENETFFYKTFWRTRFSDVGESGKSFVSTNNALTVFNHYALHSLKPGISRCYFLPEDLAQMNHYKEDCPLDLLPECIKYVSSPRVFDDVMLKYKTIFEFNFSNVLRYFL